MCALHVTLRTEIHPVQLITKAKAKDISPAQFSDDTVDEHRVLCGQIYQYASARRLEIASERSQGVSRRSQGRQRARFR
jgi:hypothetical protein